MKHWVMFGALGVIWGSSFLLIKLAVDDLGPLPLVSVRITVAALVMAAYLRASRRRWPSTRREIVALLFVGVANTALPFGLITWGEQSIDSGLATVLDATVPLFTLVFAHFALADEHIDVYKVLGLVIGFAGVALLAGRDVDSTSPNPLSGQAAVLVASAFYALSSVTIRRYLRRVDPYVVAGGSLMIGSVAILSATLLTAPLPTVSEIGLQAALAVIVLALLNTVVAYFLFYGLLDAWGSVRTSLVTYILPPVGLTLGALLLDEPIDWKIVAGTLLILSAIVAVNWQSLPRPRARAAAESSGR